MDWRKKLGLTVVVIGIGLGVALQFRKNGDAAAETSSTSSPSPAPQSELVKTAASTEQSSPAAEPLHSSAAADAGATADAIPASADEEKKSVANSNGLVDLSPPQQTHKIVDGDTLPKLSQQFLGRPDRYMEIFEYNRDVLSAPDVLPIGAELRIPSPLAIPNGSSAVVKSSALPPITAVNSTPAATNAKPAATNATPAAVPMVPLISPTAQPASATPQPAGPRTYKVQAGDNLIDIARKYYGDGRRSTDLYEANRRIMRNPGDLKPGMVLVVP